MPEVRLVNIKAAHKTAPKSGSGRPKKPATLAEEIDASIQHTIATKYAPIAAGILAETASEYGIQKDEFLAFVERNLNDYNRILLESLGDRL